MHPLYRKADAVARDALDAAMTVLNTIGMGLEESLYSRCLLHELTLRGHQVEREVPITLRYKGATFSTVLRADLLVDRCVVLELKSIEKNIRFEHKMQILSYMKMLDCPLGFVINFGPNNKDRIQRVILAGADEADDQGAQP